jgi:hypothetical protein
MSSLKIERAPWLRLGVSHTRFDEEFTLRNEADPNLPNTTIPRLRPVPLGERSRGFFSDEIDALIQALRALRDATPFVPPKRAVAPEHHPSRHTSPQRKARAKARARRAQKMELHAEA